MAVFCLVVSLFAARLEAARANVVWISIEDVSPDLGCYGVKEVATPNIDGLADNGLRFGKAFSTAGVCAPSRSAIITGLYQMSIGTQHMRSNMPKPAGLPTLPEVMRRAGYYCSNNNKQDYNFDGHGMWDASGSDAHWRNREDQRPFFSVFNIANTHEGNTWKLNEGAQRLREKKSGVRVATPPDVRVPGYYADTDVVRAHLANYYNLKVPLELTRAKISMLLEETRSSRTERRYWALRELMNGREKLTDEDMTQLAVRLEDRSIDVGLQAVRLFMLKGRYEETTGFLEKALKHEYPWARTVALGIIDEMPIGVARGFFRAVENTQEGGYVNLMRPYLLERLVKTERPIR